MREGSAAPRRRSPRESAGRAGCAARGATGDTSWSIQSTQRPGVLVLPGVGSTAVGAGLPFGVGVAVACVAGVAGMRIVGSGVAARVGPGVAGRAVAGGGGRTLAVGSAGVAFSTLRGLGVAVGAAAGARGGGFGGGLAGTTRGAAGFSAITGALNGVGLGAAGRGVAVADEMVAVGAVV